MCWSCFLVTASLTESSDVFVIHLTNVFNMLFPCDSSLFTKKTSVTGQQLAVWLLMDLLFLLFWGAYITPFWWVLLFQNSAVVPKVAQCVVPMQIRYILYISSTISGLVTWSPQDKSQSVSSHQFKTQGTKTQAKSWLTVIHRNVSIANIPAKTINN